MQKHIMHSLIFSVLLVLLGIISNAQTMMLTEPLIGSRAIGLGGAFSSVADDGSAFIYNPAGVGVQSSLMLSGSAASLQGKIGTSLGTQYWSGISVPIGDFVVAGNWLRMITNEQRIEQSLPGNDLGVNEQYLSSTRPRTFIAPQEDVFALTLAYRPILILDWGWNQFQMPIELPVGAQVRYHTLRMGTSTAQGISVDIGTMLRLNLKDMFFSDSYPLLALSFAMRNIGSGSMKWSNGRTDDAAYAYTVGTSLQQPLTPLSSDAILSYDYSSQSNGLSRLGVEWRYRKTYSIRAGIHGRNATIGSGLDFGFFIADYAYMFPASSYLGDVHSFNVSFRLERVLQ